MGVTWDQCSRRPLSTVWHKSCSQMWFYWTAYTLLSITSTNHFLFQVQSDLKMHTPHFTNLWASVWHPHSNAARCPWVSGATLCETSQVFWWCALGQIVSYTSISHRVTRIRSADVSVSSWWKQHIPAAVRELGGSRTFTSVYFIPHSWHKTAVNSSVNKTHFCPLQNESGPILLNGQDLCFIKYTVVLY